MRWLLAVAAFLLQPAQASAHLMANSVISLDFGARAVDAEILVPAGEIAFASGRSLAVSAAGGVGAERAFLEDFLARHLAVQAPDGQAWTIGPARIGIVADAWATDIRFTLRLTPPARASPRALVLSWDGVIDRAPNHFVLVFARSDFAAGTLASRPDLIGALQGARRTLSIDRGKGDNLRGLAASLGLGMAHIAHGRDHLLFLLALLLPAPLAAAAGRWTGHVGARTLLRRLVLIVSAFTLGHSLTLIGGAAFGWRLPARWVEAAIALSILVSAVHAWRPLFPGREAWLAGGFGLVHGLAFATVIGDFRLEPLAKALSILGFNLGVEIVQLGVVLAVLPALMLAAPSPGYAALRSVLAALAGAAASVWLVERIGGFSSAAGAAIDAALAHWVVIVAIATALAVWMRLGGAARTQRSVT